MTRAVINGFGAVLTALTTIIELVSKFTEGAWLIVLVIPGLVLLFSRVHRTYGRIGALLELGQTPKPPSKKKSLVVVPVVRRGTANVVLCRPPLPARAARARRRRLRDAGVAGPPRRWWRTRRRPRRRPGTRTG